MRVFLIICGVTVAVYLLLILGLMIAGKRTHARAIGGFIPDCLILFKQLLQDSRTPRRYKYALWLLIAYLSLPFDLIPDFIPIVGQLDDAIIVVLVLRRIVNGAGAGIIKEHWAGPTSSLNILLRFTGSK